MSEAGNGEETTANICHHFAEGDD